MELRRWQLSEALSYAHLAPLASVYCPVAPPASRPAAPHLTLPLRGAFQVCIHEPWSCTFDCFGPWHRRRRATRRRT